METLTIEWRGRDLALLLPPALASLDPAILIPTLVGERHAPRLRRLLVRDRRQPFVRFQPYHLAQVQAALAAHGVYQPQVGFEERPALPCELGLRLAPRPYQQEAIAAWRAEGCQGVVVLPTGAGKTFVGAMAIHEVGLWTLVVAPTLDLLAQWRRALSDALDLPPDSIGVYGGGAHEIRPITIITYESAQLHPEVLRRYGLLIFDECHHLPSPTYRRIAEGAFTPLRLGLSATPERADEQHLALDTLIGPQIYTRDAATLSAQRYLAEYEERQIVVPLDTPAQERYEAARAIYSGFVARRRLRITSPADFQRHIVWASARDPEAREAMLAWREARSLALNAPGKLAALEAIFAEWPRERILVFSEYNTLAREVSRRFLLPLITHETPLEERRQALDGFRSGRYSKLATGRVLNEGVDIPDCGVAVILSGSAVRREYVQRLGRILRPKASRAYLYEIISGDTTEERISARRRRN